MDAKKKGAPKLPMDKKKVAIVVCIVVVVLLNVMWTMLQNKFASKVDEVRADLAKLEQRVTKLEQGGLPDVAALQEQFDAMKAVAKDYNDRRAEFVKAEEQQLAALEAQVAKQKARVENLKKQAAQEVAK